MVGAQLVSSTPPLGGVSFRPSRFYNEEMALGNKIEGKQIRLRPYLPDDIDAWQKWNIDPEVQKFMPEPANKPTSRQEQLKYLEECRVDEEGIYWTIVDKTSDQAIGSIAITEINRHHGIGELGFFVGEKSYWSKGVITEAIGLVSDYAKKHMGLRRLVAEYENGNEGVRITLERNNFTLEGVAKESRVKQGKPIDTTRYFRLLK